MTKRIAFFDSHIANYQALITQLQPNTEVVILHERYDGIEQILAALQDKLNLAAIDIISHGSPGSISLGSGVLNTSNLCNYKEQLLQIGRHLTEDGDILLYGCKVAKGEIGLDFIEQLSQLTYSDVAASTSLTGATGMGGNWLLEAQTGSIRAQAMRFDYDNVLADDYLDTVDTTGSITIGGSSSGIIEESGDRDWFQISLTAGQNYVFQIDTSNGLQPFIILHGNDGNIIPFRNIGALIDDNLENYFIDYNPMSSGKYYLQASAANPNLIINTGSYTVSAHEEVDDHENGSSADDYPATTDTTGSIIIGENTNGIIEEPDDRDWFQVSLTSGQAYEFKLNSESIDPFLILYDTNGNSIIEDDDGSGNRNSLITYTATSTGTHYLEAKSFNSNEIGDYTVSAIQIAFQDDYPATTDTTGLLTIGGSTKGTLEESFDQDWFQVFLEAGHTYTFHVTSEEITNLFVGLYDDDSNTDSTPLNGHRGGDLDNFTATKTGTIILEYMMVVVLVPLLGGTLVTIQ